MSSLTHKVSLIITTKNEQENITRLLDSIAGQTKIPDEIVIVDSDSQDKTRKLLKSTAKKHNLNLNLIKQNSNRSQARNLAIKQAKNQIIAVTDAGCILDKFWLERITKPIIEDTADSVAGFYLPVTPTCFEKSVAPFVSVMPNQLDYATFLPSSRSVSFTKEAWLKVNKYPERLNFCEDLVFASKLKDNTRMVVEPKALVYWLQSTNFFSFFKQVKNYAQGDIEAFYVPHVKKIISVYLRYLVFIFFPFLFLAYLIWPISKHYKHVKQYGCFLYLPSLQITSDAAVIAGSFSGLVQRYKSFS